jgi:tRNA G18 (ribose-2'-O)-methylase SpoU
VLRAAMGACFRIPLIAMPDCQAAADWLATGPAAVEMIAADPAQADPENYPDRSSQLFSQWPSRWPVPAALVIGNEARGLSDDVCRLCRRHVAIPMPGQVESLNAATAAAILCFHLMLARQEYGRDQIPS